MRVALPTGRRHKSGSADAVVTDFRLPGDSPRMSHFPRFPRNGRHHWFPRFPNIGNSAIQIWNLYSYEMSYEMYDTLCGGNRKAARLTGNGGIYAVRGSNANLAGGMSWFTPNISRNLGNTSVFSKTSKKTDGKSNEALRAMSRQKKTFYRLYSGSLRSPEHDTIPIRLRAHHAAAKTGWWPLRRNCGNFRRGNAFLRLGNYAKINISKF